MGLALLFALGLGRRCEAADQTVTGRLTIQSGDPTLRFDDNDATPGLWEILANSDTFTIYDFTGTGTTPFKIQPRTPIDTLYLRKDSAGAGNIGINGSADDKAHLHIHAPSTPVLRMSQIAGTPYAWELNSNNTRFKLTDFNADTDPLTVQAGAPTNTLYLASTGNVGMGMAAPAARLHVVGSAVSGTESVARFQVSDDTIGKLAISNASSGNGIFIPKLQGTSASQNAALIMEGQITNDVGTSPAIVYNAFKTAGATALVTRPLVAYRNNGVVKATVAANGDVFATSFNPASSRALKDRIVDLDARKAAVALRHLTPVEYVYKDDPTAKQRVGFIAEDVPELVANADRRSVPIMDVVAVLTRVVQEQETLLQRQDKLLSDQRELNAEQQQALVKQQEINAKQQELLAALTNRLTVLESRTTGNVDPAP